MRLSFGPRSRVSRQGWSTNNYFKILNKYQLSLFSHCCNLISNLLELRMLCSGKVNIKKDPMSGWLWSQPSLSPKGFEPVLKCLKTEEECRVGPHPSTLNRNSLQVQGVVEECHAYLKQIQYAHQRQEPHTRKMSSQDLCRCSSFNFACSLVPLLRPQ